jgi:hypothetical protein
MSQAKCINDLTYQPVDTYVFCNRAVLRFAAVRFVILHKFQEIFLGMRPDLDNGACLDQLSNHLPLLVVHLEAFNEFFVFGRGPSARCLKRAA